jgi:hypothetical protein
LPGICEIKINGGRRNEGRGGESTGEGRNKQKKEGRKK